MLQVAIAAVGLAYATLLTVLSFGYAPEAAVFASIAGSLGIAASTAFLVSSVRRLRREAADGLSLPLGRAAALALLMVLSLVTVWLLGVYAFAAAFPVVAARWLGGQGWLRSAVLGAVLGAFTFGLFELAFQMRFPGMGILL